MEPKPIVELRRFRNPTGDLPRVVVLVFILENDLLPSAQFRLTTKVNTLVSTSFSW